MKKGFKFHKTPSNDRAIRAIAGEYIKQLAEVADEDERMNTALAMSIQAIYSLKVEIESMEECPSHLAALRIGIQLIFEALSIMEPGCVVVRVPNEKVN